MVHHSASFEGPQVWFGVPIILLLSLAHVHHLPSLSDSDSVNFISSNITKSNHNIFLGTYILQFRLNLLFPVCCRLLSFLIGAHALEVSHPRILGKSISPNLAFNSKATSTSSISKIPCKYSNLSPCFSEPPVIQSSDLSAPSRCQARTMDCSALTLDASSRVTARLPLCLVRPIW
jgi:hypothetical protein